MWPRAAIGQTSLHRLSEHFCSCMSFIISALSSSLASARKLTQRRLAGFRRDGCLTEQAVRSGLYHRNLFRHLDDPTSVLVRCTACACVVHVANSFRITLSDPLALLPCATPCSSLAATMPYTCHSSFINRQACRVCKREHLWRPASWAKIITHIKHFKMLLPVDLVCCTYSKNNPLSWRPSPRKPPSPYTVYTV